MKAAYFGIDALWDCLSVLLKHGCELVFIFTIEDGEYDHSADICSFAKMHGIPYKTTRATADDIKKLEAMGVEISVTAGYPWLIPLSDTIRQLNIHPSYLPEGRGAWPMPVAIMKDRASGVTIHKLAEHFDEGDIIIREKIPLAYNENLVTLTEKIRKTAVKLLDTFLESPGRLWNNAIKQGRGEYWDEPTDNDRLISETDSIDRVSHIMRAFCGYGILCKVHDVTIQIDECRLYASSEEPQGNELKIRLLDGVLAAEKWQPYFREITLADRPVLEEIRHKYPSELSDFTFSLLFCWRRLMNLRLFIGNDFFIVKGEDNYFCPVGKSDEYIRYLQGLMRLNIGFTLRFCDTQYTKTIEEHLHNLEIELQEDDCDYMMENQILEKLEGSRLHNKRNDLSHYVSQTPEPQAELITKEKLSIVKEISDASKGADYPAESEAIKYFEKLGLRGVLVKRGDRYVSFAIASEMQSNIMQGHFSKTVDSDRGASLYVIRACSVTAMKKYEYTNMEDDMGIPGLRRFKQSLHAKIVPSYTVTFKGGCGSEQ